MIKLLFGQHKLFGGGLSNLIQALKHKHFQLCFVLKNSGIEGVENNSESIFKIKGLRTFGGVAGSVFEA